MWCLIDNWKLVSENSQAPSEKIHSPLFTHFPPKNSKNASPPPFWQNWKIFQAPLLAEREGKDTMLKVLFFVLFSFYWKVMFHSWDIRFSAFLTIPSTEKIVLSRSVLAHRVEQIFEYIFWIVNHYTWILATFYISYIHGKYFYEMFQMV